jgi:hypothetical protein
VTQEQITVRHTVENDREIQEPVPQFFSRRRRLIATQHPLLLSQITALMHWELHGVTARHESLGPAFKTRRFIPETMEGHHQMSTSLLLGVKVQQLKGLGPMGHRQ